MKIDINNAVNLIKNMDNILILSHENPDGDAVGSAYALCYGLRSLGKNVCVKLDSIPKKMSFAKDSYNFDDYDFIIAVDTADSKILGRKNANIDDSQSIKLCIDHHYSNVLFAENTFVDGSAAATCEVIYDILKLLNVNITKKVAECLYLGISTDTGCFKFSNTTAKTHIIAASLMETGIDIGEINRIQFDTKSKEMVLLEKSALNSMQLYFDGKCAILPLTYEMLTQCNIDDGELSALSSMPRQIEGVLIGITVKEKEKGIFRVSVRTNPPVSASKIAQAFGGGGHMMAAGCSIKGSLDDTINQLKNICSQELMKI